MRNPLKADDIRELGPVETAPLQSAVSGISVDLWNAENGHKPNKFKPLISAQHIVFRFVNSLEDHRYSHNRPLWKIWEPKIQPILDVAVRPYGYQNTQFPRIMLAKLPAGCKIHRHRDAAPAAQFPHKIHIPLFTNDETFFCFDSEKKHLEVGKAYEVNNNIHHWAENHGQSDRIHLIFECFGN